MIAYWTLIYFVSVGQGGLVLSPTQPTDTHYVSKYECEMHAQAVNSQSGSNLVAQCQAVAN